MSNHMRQCGIGDSQHEHSITDEHLAEMMHAMQAMLTNGMPPEVIIERVTERYRNRSEDHVIREASEAFRIFVEKYNKMQHTVSKKDKDEIPACNDHLKVYISHPGIGTSSRPQSRGISDFKINEEQCLRESIKLILEKNPSKDTQKPSREYKDEAYDGGEMSSSEQLKILFGLTSTDRNPNTYAMGGFSRPQSRGTQEQRNKTESGFSLQSELQAQEDHPFFLIRSVSRDELKAAILQEVTPESSATHHAPPSAMQQIDLEPSRELNPRRTQEPCNEPAMPNTCSRPLEQERGETYLQEAMPMQVPVTVVEYVTTNESPSECIAERLIQKEKPDSVHETPNHTQKTVKDNMPISPESNIKPRVDSRGKGGTNSHRLKPPVESPLAGGECLLSGSYPASSLPQPDVIEQIVQQSSSSSRASHSRSGPSSSRPNPSRKRSTVPKKKENTLSKILVVCASFLGFAAVGGYVIYKNRSAAFNY